MNPLWHPYTQMKTMSPPYKVESAKDCTLWVETEKGPKAVIDAISSWWCTIHGYNHPKLNQALIDQTQKMAHVMLGGLTHDPAEKLAKKLVDITPSSLNHVFFSDSGSVAMEITLKMALQYWINHKRPEKKQFISLKKAYHGDTCGVISIGDPEDGMHAAFAGVFPRHFVIPTPNPTFEPTELNDLETLLKNHHTSIAAFVVEPLMLGAGGFIFYPPEYLNHAVRLCQKYDVLVIFDEIATGFGRTGTLFATNQTDISPDIMALGKGLTAGYIGHAATLAASHVYEAFYGDEETLAFMHGPTFMGNPLACAVALQSIEIFEQEQYLDKITQIHTQIATALAPLTHPLIKETRSVGAVGVIEVHHANILSELQVYALDRGVWLRPFGNIAYLAPPYIITQKELAHILDTLISYFKTR
jgi:adenosylmethionine-8-amino-7-oxononanoate aminotransferase